MENTRFAHKKDVRLPYSFDNNHTKTLAQLYGENNVKHTFSHYNKVGHGIQMNESRNITQNKTNFYTDGLNIQKRPIGETMNTNFQGIKMVRPPVNDKNEYKWTFNPQDSSLKAPFVSYNLPRSHEPRQYVGV
jgi:hypothetical protein